jgi:hypothetical protein
VIDSDDVLTEGITVPQLLDSYSYPKSKPVAKVKNRVPNKKRVKRWIPKKSVTVEIIKGTEVSNKKFLQ